MHKVKIIYLSLTLILAGCSTTQDFTSTRKVTTSAPRVAPREEFTWEAMVGKWYGKQPAKGGGSHEWVVERADDGTYQISFRVTDSRGNVKRQREVGLWGVSGGIYFTIFTGWIQENGFVPTDLEGQFTRDAYEIIRLTEQEFEYRSLEGGSIFIVEKVPGDLEM